MSNTREAHWTHSLLLGIARDEKKPAMRFTVQHMRIKNNEASNGKNYLQKCAHSTLQFRLLHVYWRSRDSVVGIMTRLQYGRPAVPTRRGSRPAMEPAQPPTLQVPGFPPRDETPEHQVDHSPASSTEVKNEWSCNSTPLYDSYSRQGQLHSSTVFQQQGLITNRFILSSNPFYSRLVCVSSGRMGRNAFTRVHITLFYNLYNSHICSALLTLN
jgi:hypothetical protein